MPLRHVLKNGRLRLDPKSIPQRIKRAIVSSSKPTFGGVELEDMKYIAFPISVAYLFTFGVLFSVMLYYQVNATVGQHFLMYPPSKAVPGLKCKSIPRNQSQTLYGSHDGFWSTERDYDEKNSIFVLNFNTGQGVANLDDFRMAMSHFRQTLSSYGKTAVRRSMIWSLMILSSITLNHPSSNLALTLSTDASFIFNNVISSMALSSAKGVCIGRSPATTFTPGSPSNLYLSATFEASRASLQMIMPFTVTRTSVFGNASDPNYSITSTPRIQETCPHHGKWVKNIFNPADPEFRNGEGKLAFDVRGLMFACALNLNLVSTNGVVVRSSSTLDQVGLFGVVDPWYTFPPMQRIYCLNKTSVIWRDNFSKDEQDDQMDVLNKLHQYPNVCFVVSNRKTKALQMFYPIVTQLKTKRLPCTNTPNGCIKGKSPPPPPFSMSTCSCPEDASNNDCNRLSIFTGLVYDTNIADSNFMKNTTTNKAKILVSDRAVKLGIAMQKSLLAWSSEAKAAGVEDNSDLRLVDLFAEVFEATMAVARNVDAADLAPKGGGISANALLAKAWGKFGEGGDGLAAIVMRSLGIEGGTNFILPINKFNVQLSDLVEDQPADVRAVSKSDPQAQWEPPAGQYYEPGMNATFKAAMCRDLFSFAGALDKLGERSPLPLTETYQKCVRTNEVSVVIALGSAWSTTNLLGGLLWAVGGWLSIHALKQRRRMTDSRTAVVTRHTKQELSEMFLDMKDEVLYRVLAKTLGRDSGKDDDDDEDWAQFRRLYYRQSGQDSEAYADDEALGAELSRRANARAKGKHEQLMEMLETIRATTSGAGGAWDTGTTRQGSLRASISGDRFIMRAHPLASNPLAARASVSVRASRRFSFNANPRRESVVGEGLPVEEGHL